MLTMGELANPEKPVLLEVKLGGCSAPGHHAEGGRLHSLLPVAEAAPNERTLRSYGWDFMRREPSQAAG